MNQATMKKSAAMQLEAPRIENGKALRIAGLREHAGRGQKENTGGSDHKHLRSSLVNPGGGRGINSTTLCRQQARCLAFERES